MSTTSSAAFNPADIQRAADLIFRDYGRYGHHSLRCIYLKDDQGITHWCCANDCATSCNPQVPVNDGHPSIQAHRMT